MVRPRKDSGIAPARERLVDAFWALAETHRVAEITVSMLTARAGCGRSTFYANFESVEDLSMAAIRDEYASQDFFPTVKLLILQGDVDDAAFDRVAHGRLLHRMGLMVRHGDQALALRGIRSNVLAVWQSILCPRGGEIKPEAQSIIEFVVGGVMTMLVWYVETYPSEYVFKGLPNQAFIRDVSKVLFSNICKAQGVDEEQTFARLESVSSTLRATTRPSR